MEKYYGGELFDVKLLPVTPFFSVSNTVSLFKPSIALFLFFLNILLTHEKKKAFKLFTAPLKNPSSE